VRLLHTSDWHLGKRLCDWPLLEDQARALEQLFQVCRAEGVDALVVAGEAFARERGLRVKARAGGHSWTASSVRDGGMLIDLSGFYEVSVDPEARTATVTPSVRAAELQDELRDHGLFFPTAHSPSVGLGGFLLQGGFSWIGARIGPSCSRVHAIDVVTADGDLIRADESQNTDFLWAARGAGPGFFGVVTRFHLTVGPRPRAILASGYVYPMEVLDDVLRWSLEISPSLSPSLELAIFGTNPRLPGGGVDSEPALVVASTAMADSKEEATRALQALETCPVVDRAQVRQVAFPTTLADLYAMADDIEPPGWRYAVDNMWTDAGADELIPQVRELFLELPTPLSHVFWNPWQVQPVQNAAFSMQGKLYIGVYAVWEDEAQDAELQDWVTGQMRRLEPLSKGIQLADENLVNRPWPYLSGENARRLEELRAKHDPDGVFDSYLIAATCPGAKASRTDDVAGRGN